MEYTIKQFGEMAGVSCRTLRYYEEIGLIKPSRINESGYRIYGEKEVDLLQQILFYKSMDFKLEEIKQILADKDFDINKALVDHLKGLISKKNEIESLIKVVEKTIAHHKGEVKMSDKEKFEAFKREQLDENEMKYGKEVREKYGEEEIETSNRKFMGLTEEAFHNMETIENEMIVALKAVIKSGDLDSKEAQMVYEKHKAWLSFTWKSYTKEAHVGVAKMYVADERFSGYYKQKVGEDCVELLSKIIERYAK